MTTSPLMDSLEQAREALTRIAELTPGKANAMTAFGLHYSVKAIAETALASLSPSTPVDGVGAEAEGEPVVTEALMACRRMFALDIYRMLDADSDEFNQAVYDVSQKVEVALAALSRPVEGVKGEPVEWLWYGEDEDGNTHVSLGRWQSHPCQSRYKLADVQPTEHDHTPPVADSEALRERVVELETEVSEWETRFNELTAIKDIHAEKRHEYFARAEAAERKLDELLNGGKADG